MKIVLRIIVILLVASVVAGAFSLAVNNTTTTFNSNEETQTFQPMERPEGGDYEGGSIAGGLGGVLVTLAKLTGITVLVLAVQKGFGLINSIKKWKPAQQ